jgi:protein YIPF1/2
VGSREYFDVEEEDIFARVRSAITLRSFNEVLHEKPDLYGPFWIATTLIVVIIAASSLLNFFYHPAIPYDFDKLSVAAFLVHYP